MKKYNITEKGTDFWGNRKFEVEEVEEKKSSDPGSLLGFLMALLIVLAFLTLPSGIGALLFYLVVLFFASLLKINVNQEQKEVLGFGSSVLSITICAFFYYYYFDKDNYYFYFPLETLNSIRTWFILILVGAFCYNVLYRIVNWGTYELEKKRMLSLKYIKYILVTSVIALIYFLSN